jgi:hypothetical protein
VVPRCRLAWRKTEDVKNRLGILVQRCNQIAHEELSVPVCADYFPRNMLKKCSIGSSSYL